MPVAVPAAVGPLPVKEALNEGFRAVVRNAEPRHGVKRVPLLRGAPAVATLHDRDPSPPIGFRAGAGLPLVEVGRAQPMLHQAVANRMEGRVALRVTEVRETCEDPVDALPLVVDAPGGSRPTESIALAEERLRPRGLADFLPPRPARPRDPLPPEDFDARLESNRRLGRSQERGHDRRGSGGPRTHVRRSMPRASLKTEATGGGAR